MALALADRADNAETSASLGHDLRSLRKAKGLTLNEVADKVNRSVGFLSQVERGLSSPSIEDLRAIASAYEVPVSWFFMTEDVDPAERGVVVRANSRRQLGTRESGIVEELLSPDFGGTFEMFRSEFEPGAEMTEAIQRETAEEGYVVTGCLDLWVDGQLFRLNSGDTFRVDHQSYRWRNPGDTTTVVVWVVSPPVY